MNGLINKQIRNSHSRHASHGSRVDVATFCTRSVRMDV